MAGSGGRALGERAPHDLDLLGLLDDDALGEPAQDGVAPIGEFGFRHIDRALVVRDHHGGEVPVRIAGGRHGHVGVHPGHRLGHQRVEAVRGALGMPGPHHHHAAARQAAGHQGGDQDRRRCAAHRLSRFSKVTPGEMPGSGGYSPTGRNAPITAA